MAKQSRQCGSITATQNHAGVTYVPARVLKKPLRRLSFSVRTGAGPGGTQLPHTKLFDCFNILQECIIILIIF